MQIVTLLFLSFQLCSGFVLDLTLTSLFSSLPALSYFSLQYSSSLKTACIFGGITPQNSSSNVVYLVDFNNESSPIMSNFTAHGPSARYNSCSLEVNGSMYIYGGWNGSAYTSELWILNITAQSWQFGGNFEVMSICTLWIEGSFLRILGKTMNNTLGLVSLQVSTLSQVASSLLFYGFISEKTTLWDGTNLTTFIPVQKSDAVVYSQNDTLVLGEFMTQNVNFLWVVRAKNPQNTSNQSSSSYILATNQNIYTLIQSTSNSSILQIRYLGKAPSSSSSIFLKYLDIPSFYLLLEETPTLPLFLKFIPYNFGIWKLILPSTPNFYSSYPVNIAHGFVAFGDGTRIVIISFITLQVYTLAKNVVGSSSNSNSNSSSSTILSSFYGVNQCIPGYTGRMCNITACPNSFQVAGMLSLLSLRYECSGHGICTSNGCSCNYPWSGPDCSSYQRDYCNRTLLKNFPLYNCECMDSTIGGNSCNITFCYNDCLGKGKCNQTTGLCQCNQRYYGADCSILRILFSKGSIMYITFVGILSLIVLIL